MAGQGNFRPNYNYPFNVFDNYMHFANAGMPPVENQAMFPIDYRQYIENPPMPSADIGEDAQLDNRMQEYNLGINYAAENYSDQMNVPTDQSSKLENTSNRIVEPHCVVQNSGAPNCTPSHSNDDSVVGNDTSRDSSNASGLQDDTPNETSSQQKDDIEANSQLKTAIKQEDTEECYTEMKDDTEENDAVNIASDKGGSKEIEDDTGAIAVKEEPLTEDENDKDNNEENEFVVSDASTIIEDYDDISNKLKKKKRKKAKSKSQDSEGSRKKPRKQKLPRPVMPREKQEFTCEVCAKVVQSLRALNKHRNLHSEKYKCDLCSKIFNSELSLKNHAKVHEGFIGSEMCNVCDKKFYDRSSLNKHTLSVHMGIKNFQCDYCFMSFFARKTYEEHVRVHTGERPFKCFYCPRSYKRISDLNHHLRLHKGETSHTCEKCGEGFRRVSELNRHMSKHGSDQEYVVAHASKPKRCSWCGLVFTTVKALQKHLSTHTCVPVLKIGSAEVGGQNPAMFEHDKQKMVNEMVQELGTGFVAPELGEVIGGAGYLASGPDLSKDLSIRNEPKPAVNMVNDFGYEAFSTSLQSMNSGFVQHSDYDKSPTESNKTVTSVMVDTNSNEEIKSDAVEFVNTNEDVEQRPTRSPSESNEKNTGGEDSYKNEEIKNNENGATETEMHENEKQDDTVKTELDETVLDSVDEHDESNDYGGDTDMEDYNYVMNTSEVVNKGEIIQIKVEVDVNADEEHELKDDDTKDPDFILSSDRKQKRKASVPRKNIVKKKKVKSEPGDDVDTREGKETEVVKKRTKTKKTNPIIEDGSMDLESLKCLQCLKLFSKKISLLKHMHLHRGTFSCKVCSKRFSTKKSLEIHTDNHEGRKVNTAVCNVCDKAFYDNSSLNKHVKTVHMDYKPHSCTECNRKFSENKSLVEHMRVHTGERPFACEICGKTYKRVSELNFHIRKHSGEVNLNCPECGKGFMRMGQLRQHMLLRHDKERPFRCFLCAKTFPTHPMLKDHQKQHLSQRKHVCDKCGHKFHTRAKLNKHLNRKTDCQTNILCGKVGQLICRVCYRQFETVDDKKTHMKEVHPDEVDMKPTFPCGVCGKCFNRSQTLKTHLKIHYQVRDHKCTQCSAAFIQRHHLTQHIATHTGARLYQCPICLKKFAHNATLYNHMRHH